MSNTCSTKSRTILWSVPRSISTAFERAIVQLKILNEKANTATIDIYHEPLSRSFYYSIEQESPRFPIVDNTLTFQQTMDQILNSKADYVFSKDMGYYTRGRVPKLISKDVFHTFIIRHPSKTIPSLYQASIQTEGYVANMDFDADESGFNELLDIFNYVKDELQQVPIIIDSDDLLTNPYDYMKEYCRLTKLPWDENMLTWESGITPEGWEDWNGWHDSAINSTGLIKKKLNTNESHKNKYEKELNLPIVKDAIEKNLKAYEELLKHKLII